MPVPLELRAFRVRSLDLDFHEVSWELQDTSEDVLDYSFQLLRSEGAGGPFDPLTVPFTDRYVFVDNELHVGDRWRKYFYQLRITHLASGDTKDFGPVAHEADPDLVAQELRKHFALLMQEFAGRRCWVLPARTFGQRCSCWNAVQKQRTRSGCRTCFDTGFVRGYLSPVETWIQIDPSPKTEQNTNVGAQQQSNTSMRMPYYPPVKPRDLVIEGENRRWRVTQVSFTEKGRAIVHQEVQLHEIPPKDIEFTIPLELGHDLTTIALSPARNFSNPQNLEAFLDQNTPGILSLYRKKT